MNTYFSKITRFLKALFWHLSLGSPKSTREQILYRYNICKQCEYFDNNKSQCLVCGCNLSDKSIFLNKLAWADQKCPVDKWDRLV